MTKDKINKIPRTTAEQMLGHLYAVAPVAEDIKAVDRELTYEWWRGYYAALSELSDAIEIMGSQE